MAAAAWTVESRTERFLRPSSRAARPGTRGRVNLMSCIATRAMVAAFAVYVLVGLGHSAVLTWAAVAVSVVAVVAWSLRGRLIGRPVCRVPCRAPGGRTRT